MGKIINMNREQRAIAKEKARLEKRNKAKKWIYSSTLIAAAFSALLWILELKWYIFIIPFILHVLLLFYTFSVQFYTERKRKQVWAAYVNKYGKNGVVPEHVKMIHRKLIAQGKKIKV